VIAPPPPTSLRCGAGGPVFPEDAGAREIFTPPSAAILPSPQDKVKCILPRAKAEIAF